MSIIRAFVEIIKEIGKEENIKVEQFSNDWIIKLSKNNKIKYIIGYKFDINSSCTSEICDDKYALYSILKNSKIPVIQHEIIFKNQEEKLQETVKKDDFNIVIKPNRGTCGNDVYHINSMNEALAIYNRMIQHKQDVCVCPFYNIKNEYRAIYLNGKVEFAYKKVKPVIVGNGKNTIKELLLKFNESYYSNKENFKNKEFDIKYIPKEGEKIVYEWRFNLSKGSNIDEIPKEELEIIESISKSVANEINLKFGSIDIIKTVDDEYKIIEVNSGVMMENLINLKYNGREIAKEIYRKVINFIFNVNQE